MEKRKIEPISWIKYFESFNSINQDRIVQLESSSEDISRVKNMRFQLKKIIYQPASRGNTLFIELDSKVSPFIHQINDPFKITAVCDYEGYVSRLEILNKNFEKTKLFLGSKQNAPNLKSRKQKQYECF